MVRMIRNAARPAAAIATAATIASLVGCSRPSEPNQKEMQDNRARYEARAAQMGARRGTNPNANDPNVTGPPR